jgi:hypothetical protein
MLSVRYWIGSKALGRSRIILGASALAALLGVLAPALPARAASVVQINWVNATTVRIGGNAVRTPVDVAGTFEGNVYGTPAGSLTFMALSNGPVEMSFGCKVTMTLDIFQDTNGSLDYTNGKLIFTTSSPSTCSQNTLKSNIDGLVNDPMTGTENITLQNIVVGGQENRGPASGNDSVDKQLVNVTAGMGFASDYNNIPSNDTFMLCEAKGDYANNIDALFADCLAQKSTALSMPAITSNPLATIQDGKGPNGGDEKGWTGQFKDAKAAIYVACSANFKACQLFTKNPGEVAEVYVIYGTATGSVIPGEPPGQGAPDKVCTTGNDTLSASLAWILCPVVQMIAGATNFFENNIIIPFMTVSPLTTSSANPIYVLWQSIRNIANIGFIIFFFIVIFSQATSIGISNYGIKRILPKMAIVVIGVNLSYFIVAFVIDAFNIFGAGISQLVMSALQQAGTSQLTGGGASATIPSKVFALGGAALLTVVAGAGPAISWLFSFMLLAILVVVVVVMVLMIRQMAIIMLVIIAPVAILMYMLPNTEPYFAKWRKMLVQLLMMYPMIVLLFAAGKVFGVMLQQPDFKLTGDGVTEPVAQAIRVILQFLVYVIPLVFLPATFAASGAIMGKAYSALANRAVQSRANRLKEDAALMAGETRQRIAQSKRLPGLNKLAGRGLNRDYVRAQRQRNLQHVQEEYTAKALENSAWLRYQAAGVAGQQGKTRAAAYAAQVATKGRKEDIDNEMALLDAEARSLGIDQKTFAAEAGRYFEDPDGKRDDGTNKSIIYGSNGQKFDISSNPQFKRALLNSAASQGEVAAIRAARTSSNVNQSTLDDIIRLNDSKLKEKGGYDLATNFGLAYGRMYESDAKGIVPTDAQGRPTSPEITDQAAMKKEMAKHQFLTIASSGANSVAQMKAGVLGEAAKIIQAGTKAFAPNPSWSPEKLAEETKKYNTARDAYDQLSDETKEAVYNRLHAIAENSNVLAKTEAPKAIQEAEAAMRGVGFIRTQI